MKKLILIVLFVAGCNHPPKTMGAVCSVLDRAVCDRAVECSMISANNIETCVNAFNITCCSADETCEERANSAIEKYVEECSKAIVNWPCEKMLVPDLPKECLIDKGEEWKL